MRVLLTTDTVGGVWTFTRELTEQLLTRGDNVALVSFGRPPSTEQSAWLNLLAAAHDASFQFHASDAPLEWMQDNDLVWHQGGKLLTGVADSFQPDILHSNQFCWGALPLDVPKLITAHSDVRSWAAACRPAGLAQSGWLDRYTALVQNGIDCAHGMVAPTDWMRDALCLHFNVAAPFHVIPNGRTFPNLTFERKRKLQAVSVGRLWDEGKGLATLSEIVPPMPVLLAGEPCFGDAESGFLQCCFTSLGTLDEESLLELFCTSPIYLATSFYEPFGLAPLEAALCGCAIVARDIPTFREVWRDAAVYFKDAIGLQIALADLARNSGQLHRMQVAAEERARFYTAKSMADNYACLYRELILSPTGSMATVEEELHAA